MLENHVITKADLNQVELRLTSEMKLMRSGLLANDESIRNALINPSNKMLLTTEGLLGSLMTPFHFLH